MQSVLGPFASVSVFERTATSAMFVRLNDTHTCTCNSSRRSCGRNERLHCHRRLRRSDVDGRGRRSTAHDVRDDGGLLLVTPVQLESDQSQRVETKDAFFASLGAAGEDDVARALAQAHCRKVYM